jgi:DNA topoisomerase-1
MYRMIVYRFHKNGKKDQFDIKDKNGKPVTDKKILDYIKVLVIPPAYRDVKIFIESSPKILFEGFDDKGRKQQIYSCNWIKKAKRKKFQSLLKFGKMLPNIYLSINKHIRSPGIGKEKIISMILRIISVCYFRIGNLKYQKLYGSFGISTIQKKHVLIGKGSNIEIKFIGKKGVLNECVVTDEILIKEIKNLYNSKASPTDFMFVYEEASEKKLITALDVNDWLKGHDPSFTTKMFRTFDTNVLLIEYLKRHHSGTLPGPAELKISHRKKNIVNAMKEISNCVNNTPAICKKSYANNDLIELYIHHPKKFEKEVLSDASSRVIFINFLKKNYDVL